MTATFGPGLRDHSAGVSNPHRQFLPAHPARSDPVLTRSPLENTCCFQWHGNCDAFAD
jgi:hypothetical protein